MGRFVWHSVANDGSRIEVDKRKLQLTKKERDPHCQELCLKDRGRLSLEGETFCQRTLKLTDTLEVVRAVRHLHRMDERQRPIMTNSESESERSLRQP